MTRDQIDTEVAVRQADLREDARRRFTQQPNLFQRGPILRRGSQIDHHPPTAPSRDAGASRSFVCGSFSVNPIRTPIRRNRSPCARAAIGNAATVPPSSAMKSRRLIDPPTLRTGIVLTQTSLLEGVGQRYRLWATLNAFIRISAWGLARARGLPNPQLPSGQQRTSTSINPPRIRPNPKATAFFSNQ